jgi:hypothetical protein
MRLLFVLSWGLVLVLIGSAAAVWIVFGLASGAIR